MMKNILYSSIVCLLFASCSSNSKKEATPLGKKENDEYYWIDDNDFDKVAEEKFIPKEDSYIDTEEIDDNSLAKESVDKVAAPKLMEFKVGKDQVGKMVIHCYRGNFAGAMKLFSSNYRKYKGHPSYWNQLGTCYSLRKKYRQATLYYNKSRDLNKDYAPPINNLGVIYQRQGYNQKALAAYKKAYDMNSFSLTPAFNLSQLYLKYGFYEDAKIMLMALHTKNKKDIDVVHGLGTIYMAQGESREAVRIYSKLNRDQLEIPTVGLGFSLALKMVGREKDAQSIYNSIKVSSIKNDDLKSYYHKVGKYVGERK